MILITDEMIERAQQNNKNLRMELAIILYSSEVFHLRKAAEIAGVSWLDLTSEANKRNIPAWDSITEEDFERELETIRQFRSA